MLLRYLSPQIEQLERAAERQLDESDILTFLRKTTLVGLLPGEWVGETKWMVAWLVLMFTEQLTERTT